MDHIAILSERWHFEDKLKSGQKTIECRWYKKKYKPWNSITEGDIIYFKKSGKYPITYKATVSKVEQFENLNSDIIAKLFNKYGTAIGIEKSQIPSFIKDYKNRKYGIIIHIKDVESVNPFMIDKKGYGSGSAWLPVDNIELIKADRIS